MYNPLSEQEMLIEAAKQRKAKPMGIVGAVMNGVSGATGIPVPALAGAAKMIAGGPASVGQMVIPEAAGAMVRAANSPIVRNTATVAMGGNTLTPPIMNYQSSPKMVGNGLIDRETQPKPTPEQMYDREMRMAHDQFRGQPIQPAAASPAAQVAAPGSMPDPNAGLTERDRMSRMLSDRLMERDLAIRGLRRLGSSQGESEATGQQRDALLRQRWAAEGKDFAGGKSDIAIMAAALNPRQITTPEQDAASKAWLEQKLMGVNRDREAGMALPPSPEDAAKLATLPRVPTAAEVANSPEKMASQRDTAQFNQDAQAGAAGFLAASENDRAYRLREKEAMRAMEEKARQVAMSGMDRQVTENSPDAIKMRQEMEKEMMALRLAEVQSQGRVAAAQRGTAEQAAMTTANAEAVSTPEFTGPVNRIAQAANSWRTITLPTERNAQRLASIKSDVDGFLKKARAASPEQQAILRQMLKDQMGTTFAVPNAMEDLTGLNADFYQALAPLQVYLLGG